MQSEVFFDGLGFEVVDSAIGEEGTMNDLLMETLTTNDLYYMINQRNFSKCSKDFALRNNSIDLLPGRGRRA